MEIDAQDELEEEVLIELEDGSIIQQKIIYEWIPPKCTKCCCFGHLVSQCPTVEVGELKVITM